jgi:transcriptional antiterminator NusG
MIATIRTTTGRENIVMDSIALKVKTKNSPLKSVFHPEELRGYVFIEGEQEEIENCIRGIQHVHGFINKNVDMSHIERFLIPAKSEIKFDVGDIVEILGSPFKGEKAKITRVSEGKNEITVELLEAAIPIPVTISVNSVRLHEKKRE